LVREGAGDLSLLPNTTTLSAIHEVGKAKMAFPTFFHFSVAAGFSLRRHRLKTCATEALTIVGKISHACQV